MSEKIDWRKKKECLPAVVMCIDPAFFLTFPILPDFSDTLWTLSFLFHPPPQTPITNVDEGVEDWLLKTDFTDEVSLMFLFARISEKDIREEFSYERFISSTFFLFVWRFSQSES
jgi:hypothetical protein